MRQSTSETAHMAAAERRRNYAPAAAYLAASAESMASWELEANGKPFASVVRVENPYWNQVAPKGAVVPITVAEYVGDTAPSDLPGPRWKLVSQREMAVVADESGLAGPFQRALEALDQLLPARTPFQYGPPPSGAAAPREEPSDAGNKTAEATTKASTFGSGKLVFAVIATGTLLLLVRRK